MQYMIREMKSQEYRLLSDFLYEAIYIPEGVEAPPRSVIDFPELQEYIIEFGNRKHDKALVAEIQGDIVGAIWVRIMNDYGHIDNDTPSLAMSVCPRYRGLLCCSFWDFGTGRERFLHPGTWHLPDGFLREYGHLWDFRFHPGVRRVVRPVQHPGRFAFECYLPCV